MIYDIAIFKKKNYNLVDIGCLRLCFVYLEPRDKNVLVFQVVRVYLSLCKNV
jgi:hypothetical protein